MCTTKVNFEPKGANETDVREEYLAKVLAGLGYRRGTTNDVLIEFPLAYDKITLGRPKRNSPQLKGKADYLLKAGSAARWVLEAKAPNPISNQDIDQVLSYARHPEVSASYAAICNDLEFCVYRVNQFSQEEPIIKFKVTSVDDAVGRLSSTLHPECMQRGMKNQEVSQLRPIALGRSATEIIENGFSRILEFWSWHNLSLNELESKKLEALGERLVGMETTIAGGSISRTANGVIVAIIDWSSPHYLFHNFLERNSLNRNPINCLSTHLSTDPEIPTYFEMTQNIRLSKGEKTFNILEWKEEVIPDELEVIYTSQAMGYLQGDIFVGFINGLMTFLDPNSNDVVLEMHHISSLEVQLAS